MTEKQYTDEFIDIIEYFYGSHYLSQGGVESVNDLFKGEKLNNKIIADIGCGTGGPAIHIAQLYPVKTVIGIDVDPDLLKRAAAAAERHQVSDKLIWKLSKPETAL